MKLSGSINEGFIVDYLSRHGAEGFAKQLRDRPNFKKLLDESRLTMIIAPSDIALADVAAKFGQSVAEFLASPVSEDILANHLSVVPTQKVYPLFTSINGSKFGSGPQDLTELQPIANTIIGTVPIIVVNRAIFHESQYPDLTLNRLGKDPLFLILQQSRPMDVLQSCRTTKTFARLCRDPATFRQLMHLHYPQYPINADARQQYTDITLRNGYAYYAFIHLDNITTATMKDGSVAEDIVLIETKQFEKDDTRNYLSQNKIEEIRSKFPDRNYDDLTLIKIYGNGLDNPTQFWVPITFTSSAIWVAEPDNIKNLVSVRKEDVARYVSYQVPIEDLIIGVIDAEENIEDYNLYKLGRLSEDKLNPLLIKYGLPAPLNANTIFDRLMTDNVIWEFPNSEYGWGLVQILISKTP